MSGPFAPKRVSPRRAVGLRPALQTLMLTTACCVPAHAEERTVAPRGGLEAKLEYCNTCHGLSGQGYRGYFPMPRLAGQSPQYIESQLRAFIERRRTNPIMAKVAQVLSPSMITGLAAHFKALDPMPIGGAPRGSLALGKQIFAEGLPESNVPACSACHGPEGRGQHEIPRLAGQLYEYTVAQLTNWSKVRAHGPVAETSEIMVPAARNLTKSQMEALAAYVSFLH